MSIIETRNLSHRYSDDTLALREISLSFDAGEFVVIAGANGSGKTTLLRHFNGLLMPESGLVNVCGRSVQKDPMAARQQVGMVFQDADSQIVGETVYDDAAFGPENLRLDRDQINTRVTRALADVNLTGCEDKSPHKLSGGEKRRLAIAGVLAMAPRVLLMDEPFSNLDYPATCMVLDQILNFHRNGHTIIIATHDLEKVIAHALRLVVLQRGRVVADGAPEQIINGIERYGVRPPCSVQLGRGIQSWVI
jgi:biotin transport system ATP-binding protein